MLDLGSGSGRDCYAISNLVGETGQVIGVDMTESQVIVFELFSIFTFSNYLSAQISFKCHPLSDRLLVGINNNK